MNQVAKYGGGFVTWTGIEYWIHRELGHHLNTPLRKQHLEHHRHPEKASSPRWALVALILLLPSDPFLTGLVAGYFCYSWIHHREHHRADSNRHLRHHGRPDANFGVSTRFWDRVLGTLLV